MRPHGRRRDEGGRAGPSALPLPFPARVFGRGGRARAACHTRPGRRTGRTAANRGPPPRSVRLPGRTSVRGGAPTGPLDDVAGQASPRSRAGGTQDERHARNARRDGSYRPVLKHGPRSLTYVRVSRPGKPSVRGESADAGAPHGAFRRDRVGNGAERRRRRDRRRKRRVRGTTGRPGTDGRSTAPAPGGGCAFPCAVPADGARDRRKENGRPSGEGSEPEHVRQDPKDGDLRLRRSKVGGNSDGSSRLVLTCKSFFRRRA